METVKWNVLTVCIFPIYLDLSIKQMSIVIPHDQWAQESDVNAWISLQPVLFSAWQFRWGKIKSDPHSIARQCLIWAEAQMYMKAQENTHMY